VSTRDQTADNQLAELRSYAACQNWTIVAEYSDTESGGKAERPGYQEMLTAASRRRFDVLLFWSLDRLSREGAARTLEVLNRLHSWGVRVRSYTEQYLDTCGLFADAVVAVLATIARQERLRISERTRAGLERARKRGRRPGRRRLIFDLPLAARLRADGLSWRIIGRLVGAAPSTVRRTLSDYLRSSSSSEAPKTTSPAISAASSPGAPEPGADGSPIDGSEGSHGVAEEASAGAAS
jgi:DNA invertase Pin-like site-specific DNA recombinase